MRHSKVSWGTTIVDPLRLTPEKVRELRQLCHPDRHGGSPLSVRVSQWLTDVSKALDTAPSNKR
jgi:hypothetical protein